MDGNEYVDYGMGNASYLLGHGPPAVLAAIHAAIDQGLHFGEDHPLQLEWAQLITEMIPVAERVRFVNSGTEAGYQSYSGLTPDLCTLGKIVTGGMPGAVVAGRPPPASPRSSRSDNGNPHNLADEVASRPRLGQDAILEEERIAGSVYGDSSVFPIYLEAHPGSCTSSCSPTTAASPAAPTPSRT